MRRFESRFERWRPQLKGGWRESGDPAEIGGLLYDLGSHVVDQALTLFGPATSVYAESDVRRPGAETDDDTFIALTHANGVRSHLYMSAIAAQLGPRFRVLGSEAAYVKYGLDPQEAALREGARPHGGRRWGVEPESAWGPWATSARDGPSPTLDGDYPAYYAGDRHRAARRHTPAGHGARGGRRHPRAGGRPHLGSRITRGDARPVLTLDSGAGRARSPTRGRAGAPHASPATAHASLNSWRCRPSPSISSSTTSPARRYGLGSGAPIATPAGVPVLMTSPGQQRHELADVAHHFGDREDLLRRRAVLLQLTVDPQPQTQRLRVAGPRPPSPATAPAG